MISVVHLEHEKVSEISRHWCKRYPARWDRMLAVANLLDVPLLALLYQRFRELQDATARESLARQEDFGVVAWERRERLRAGGCGTTDIVERCQHREITRDAERNPNPSAKCQPMVCIFTGCTAQLWRQTRAETEEAARAAGWRDFLDGKTPQLYGGACLCPAHADRAAEFQPAKRGAK